MTSKYTKAEDFIGWKSEDGLLEVIGIAGKVSGKSVFKVTCSVCAKDPELFPDGYFLAYKSGLDNGSKPCGCSKAYKWSKNQYLIRAARSAQSKNLKIIKIHDNDNLKGKKARLDMECLICGYTYNTSFDTLINSPAGCKECWNQKKKIIHRTPSKEVIQKVLARCNDKGYSFVGFPNKYLNNRSKLLYLCPTHGVKSCSVANFCFKDGRGCPDCAADNKALSTNTYGYYEKRKDEKDYFYVIKIGKYVKIGRSFNVDTRIREHARHFSSPCEEIMFVHEGTHKYIFDLEQTLIKYLKSLGYNDPNSPSPRETFTKDCTDILFSKIKEILGE
jgi:hypothetical protein